MKLITEYNDSLVEFKKEEVEDTDGLKVQEYYIEGIFMQADIKNRNGRIYEKKILKPAVDKYISEQVKQDRAVGELNHPAGPTVNLDKVSHKIEALEWDGSNVIGRAKILDTPMGRTVKNLLDGDVKLGVSSRGMGSIIKREGSDYVKDDFVINTVDIVQDPSAHSAFVNGIMEGIEWAAHGDSFVQVEEALSQETLIEMKLGDSVRVGNQSGKIVYIDTKAKPTKFKVQVGSSYVWRTAAELNTQESKSINNNNDHFIRAFRETMSRF